MIKPRLRVLLIAEAANPEWASVPLVGWSMATAIAGITDAHIVTQVRNRPAFLRAGLVEGSDFTAIDTEAVSRRIAAFAEFLRRGSGMGWTMQTAISSLAYPYFEHRVWKNFGKRIQDGEFDIVHRITPLTPTASSLIAPKVAAAGIPFVMGPLNGGVPWPPGFEAEQRREREWLSYVRGAFKWLPGIRRTYRSAALVFCGSKFTLSDLPQRYAAKYEYEPENGIDSSRFTQRCTTTEAKPLKLCFVGRLVPYKCPDIVLMAAEPHLRSGSVTLDIVGDGPMMAELKDWVSTRGLDAKVTFHGWLEHRQVQTVLAQSNLLTFPSIREFGGGVVLEAMAVGLVPIVVDYAGPGELVEEAWGYKLPLTDRANITRDLDDLLATLIANPTGIAQKSEKCIQRVNAAHTWSAKAAKVLQHYDALLAANG
jgi:glycosyltransferase involved in cell wall biosynthesis